MLGIAVDPTVAILTNLTGDTGRIFTLVLDVPALPAYSYVRAHMLKIRRCIVSAQ